MERLAWMAVERLAEKVEESVLVQLGETLGLMRGRQQVDLGGHA